MASRAFLVRRAMREDFDQWRLLWDGYNEFYGRAGATALPSDMTELTWQRFFDEREPLHALVAEAEGTLVGLAHYLFHLSTTSAAPVCYLRDLYTSCSARGAGVATSLIAYVCDEARKARSEKVYWQTHRTNHVARALYAKLAKQSDFLLYEMTA